MNTNFTPAFPTWVNDDSMMPGMTLRDYFASMAMQGLLSTGCYFGDTNKNISKIVSKESYEIADAMMGARK